MATTYPTFSPTLGPSYPYSEPRAIPVDIIPMESGTQQVRAVGLTELRRARYDQAVSTDDRDYVMSFIHGLEGGVGPFWWTPPNKVPSPSGIDPTLTQILGGAIAERTYYVRFTWYDAASGETKQSGQSSLTVAANYYLVVAIPAVPTEVDGWRLYAHETSGSECLQATVTTARTWTQSAALSTGTATPPATSTLSQAVKWLVSGDVTDTRISTTLYRVAFDMVEIII